MRQACKWVGTAWLGIALIAGTGAAKSWAAPQDQAQKPAYTMAEYNAYQTAHTDQNPQQKAKELDAFVAQYPNSTLMNYVYQDYYLTYIALKDYGKSIDYVDRLLALGDKVDFGARMQAYVARAQAFFLGSADKALQTPDAYTKARDASAAGLKALDQWQKPANATDEAFAAQKKSIAQLLDTVTGISDSGLKDYKAAADAYKADLTLDPNDNVGHYRLGVADLAETPPSADGFWELSRAIALKAPGDAQIKAYMRNQLLHYQQPGCEKLVDDEITQLLTLAGSSGDRPATLLIPSADDLQKAREDTADFLPWLQEGGDHGKTMWLATCGLEYPDVGVRVMDITPGDGDALTLHAYRPTATDPDAMQKEMDAATAPNFDVHVAGQPDAKRVQKDDVVRFTGTLTGYQQSPFLLSWDNAKVNPDDLQPEKPAPGAKKPTHGAAPKKPGA